MSVGPSGMVGSIAGSPLSQTRSSEAQRSQQSAGQAGQAQTGGVGEASPDQQASERDADGRRLWEQPTDASADTLPEEAATEDESQSRDPSGNRGLNLDLSG